jgi:hypothetical protein
MDALHGRKEIQMMARGPAVTNSGATRRRHARTGPRRNKQSVRHEAI